MTIFRLKERLDELRESGLCIGYCYGNFPENQETPYIAYRTETDNQIFADGVKIYGEESVLMDIYTEKRDLRLENTINCILQDEKVQYTQDFEFDETQKVHIVSYRFTTE